MTPFYHPYARLWLPLHAAGWVLMAGLVVRLGPFTQTSCEGPLQSRIRYQAAAAAICLLLARWHWAGHLPHPLPSRIMNQLTGPLEEAIANLRAGPAVREHPERRLRVLARRPVAFYLAVGTTVSFRLLPDPSEILSGPGNSGEWALVDEAQAHNLFTSSGVKPNLLEVWRKEASWQVAEDPVTLLDINPNAPFEGANVANMLGLVLLAPKGPASSRAAHGRTP
jgi:hypothetical protein